MRLVRWPSRSVLRRPRIVRSGVERLEARELLTYGVFAVPLSLPVGQEQTVDLAGITHGFDETAAPLSATIDWGDGSSPTEGTVITPPHSISDSNFLNFSLEGTHSYRDNSPADGYLVTITVHNSATGEDLRTATRALTTSETTVTLSSSANPGLVGRPVTITAVVAPTVPGAPTPTGSVSFLDGQTLLGTVPVDATGHASLSHTFSPGSHVLAAGFSGDPRSLASTTTAGLAQTIDANVGTLVSVAHGKLRRKGRAFVETVSVKNVSDAGIAGPIELVLDSLPARTRLKNPSGTTSTSPPAGSPFVTLPLDGSGALGAGQTATVTLVFSARRAKAVAFSPRVLAGLSPP